MVSFELEASFHRLDIGSLDILYRYYTTTEKQDAFYVFAGVRSCFPYSKLLECKQFG